jgi:hypothetical protein
MPSDDKKGLPSLITKGIGTDLTRRRVMQGALSTVAKDLIPFAAKEILAAKDFDSLQKIKEVKPLLTKYFTIYKEIDNLPEKIWGKKVLEERVHDDYITSNVDSYNAGRLLYKELIHSKNKRDALQEQYNKYAELLEKEGVDPEEYSGYFDMLDYQTDSDWSGNLSFEELEGDLDNANEDYKQLLSIIASPESALDKKYNRFPHIPLKDLDKKSIQFVLQNLALDHQLQDIKIEASDKKLPFTFFAKFIDSDLWGKSNITNKDIQESIKRLTSNDPKWGRGKHYLEQEEYIRKLSTSKGLAEEVEKKYQSYLNTPEGGVKGWRTSTQGMTPQEAEQWQKQAIEKFLRSRLQDLKYIYESKLSPHKGNRKLSWDINHIDSLNRLDRFVVGDHESQDKNPLEQKQRIEDIKEDIKKVAIETTKALAKDYVKDKIVKTVPPPPGSLGRTIYKPGPWTQKIADYLKSLKTPSGPTIESDKTRASKAKVVEEVKPNRNLAEDLKRVGRVIKASPYVAGTLTAITPTKIDREYTAELPLDPRAIEIERALQRGRISRDPYKNYNKQRAI